MPEDPLIGTLLGQYQVESVLGKGGMATVYKGIQVAVNRVVAIKVLPGSFTHDDTFMTRFRQEAEVAAQLEHIRILPVYDYGEQDGVPFIVMRYIDGGTLRQQTLQGPIETKETLQTLYHVAAALDYAHGRNVIHRDLKPSNVMMDSDGNTYLADFGTAKLRDRSAQLTGSGIVGTPAYMAPEQSMPGQVTPAVDIYALGVTLFEMITGHVPYSADTPIVQILMHIQHPVPSLLEYNDTVPREVDTVVKRAMAKRPEDRYQLATELAMALEEAVSIAGGWGAAAGANTSSIQKPTSKAASRSEQQLRVRGSTEAAGTFEDVNDIKRSDSVEPLAVPVESDEHGNAFDLEVTDYQSDDYEPTITPIDLSRSQEPIGLTEPVGIETPPPRFYEDEPRTSNPMLVSNEGESFELVSSNSLIGRSDPRKGIFVDIDLTQMDVRKRTSRSHARILARDNEYIVWDLHSMNGTFVNGRRVPEGGRREIRDGDVIQFGKDGGVLLTFERQRS